MTRTGHDDHDAKVAAASEIAGRLFRRAGSDQACLGRTARANVLRYAWHLHSTPSSTCDFLYATNCHNHPLHAQHKPVQACTRKHLHAESIVKLQFHSCHLLLKQKPECWPSLQPFPCLGIYELHQFRNPARRARAVHVQHHPLTRNDWPWTVHHQHPTLHTPLSQSGTLSQCREYTDADAVRSTPTI